MPDYKLEDDAENDLLEIGRYTARTWSLEQAERYLTRLYAHFAVVAEREAFEKPVFDHRDDLRVSRCEHHYVFFVRETDGDVVILAVLHESMDLVSRLRDRLEQEE